MPTTEQTFSAFREQVINQFVELELELRALDLAFLNQPTRVDVTPFRKEAEKQIGDITAKVRRVFPE
jgi:hypothetical protein